MGTTTCKKAGLRIVYHLGILFGAFRLRRLLRSDHQKLLHVPTQGRRLERTRSTRCCKRLSTRKPGDFFDRRQRFGFANAIKDCISYLGIPINGFPDWHAPECLSQVQALEGQGKAALEDSATGLEAILNKIESYLSLKKTEDDAKSAKIRVVLYPNVMNTSLNQNCMVGHFGLQNFDFTPAVQGYLQSFMTTIDNEVVSIVNRYKGAHSNVNYVDDRSAFAANDGQLCDSVPASQQDMNGYLPSGLLNANPKVESFHPTVLGQEQIEKTVLASLS